MNRPTRPAIILVGPMGAGKSTVGRCLAECLRLDFYDTDTELELRCGADIPWIFDIEGEGGFRRRETEVLSELVHRPNTILATGGGIVLAPENRALMRQSVAVIYLTASVDDLYKRVAKDKGRPLLQVEDPESTYRAIFNQRDPLYREVANHIITTNNVTAPTKVARNIVDLLG